MVDKETNRAVFAETKPDFVDLLLSFFTLPMGTITRLVSKLSSPTAIGCMKNLYNSVETLPQYHFKTRACKNIMLLRPLSHPTISVDYRNVVTFADIKGVFVKGGLIASYIVTDDLPVTYASMDNWLSLFSKLGVGNSSNLEERTVNIGLQTPLQLLNRSLSSSSPMTDVFLCKEDRKPSGSVKIEMLETSRHQNKKDVASQSKKVMVKLMYRKSNKKVMYTEANEDFVNMLFSFLTISPGSVEHMFNETSSMVSIDNLYMSIENLSTDDHMKTQECKTLLAQPKLSPYLGCENQLLPIEEELPLIYVCHCSKYVIIYDTESIKTKAVADKNIVKLWNPKCGGT
ncbi:hypothetical protein GIB67_007619 [Kingdonia uniflora]|uniref:Uncharacterized protein n=1 Tax=Kingdonia uniflora TaxID=39325 RepID=A0A7J7N235_9MAGN|nr:hypothetical protein GIB67_007619 [Kingdonia uniflora]